MRSRLLGSAAVLGLAMALAGCGSGAGPGARVSASTTAAPLQLTASANHTTVHATVGQTVTVDLGSTYWSALTSSAPAVLQPVEGSHPIITSTPSSFCPPGGGCGALPSSFLAKAPGTAQLTANRHVCGEALACSPDQRTFTVTVDVTR
jgi:hypothetical protein